MAPRARTLVLPLAAATVLIASTIFLFAAAGARWRPADTGLPAPAAAAAFSVVPVSVNSSTDGQELSFVDENGRPDDPNASSAAGRCDPSAAAIRVFMYDMPPEFHFGLLGWVPPAGEVRWVRRGVQGPESVADHMYRMGVMALVAADLPGVDRDRCVKMAIVHDIAEAIVGDITPSDGVPKEEKSRREKEALDHMCGLLGGGSRVNIGFICMSFVSFGWSMRTMPLWKQRLSKILTRDT